MDSDYGRMQRQQVLLRLLDPDLEVIGDIGRRDHDVRLIDQRQEAFFELGLFHGVRRRLENRREA